MPNPAAPPDGGSMSDSSLGISVIAVAQRAFSEALPELLKKHRGQWVAFSGATRLGFGRTKTELYRYCLDKERLARGYFVVRLIEEEDSDEVEIGGSLID